MSKLKYSAWCSLQCKINLLPARWPERQVLVKQARGDRRAVGREDKNLLQIAEKGGKLTQRDVRDCHHWHRWRELIQTRACEGFLWPTCPTAFTDHPCHPTELWGLSDLQGHIAEEGCAHVFTPSLPWINSRAHGPRGAGEGDCHGFGGLQPLQPMELNSGVLVLA